MSVHLIENRCFAECTSLTEFTIPDSLIDVTGNPFVGCKKLETITLSDSHPTLMMREGILMDKRTDALLCYPYVRQDEEFRVPEGTLEIGASAFESTGKREGDVPKLRIVLPESVVRIRDYAFSEC